MSLKTIQEPLYSDLGSDLDLAHLVELFVDEMPSRIESMLTCVEKRDWEGLGRIAHQLKGAAGSYGFGEVTPYAAQLESDCRNQASAEVIVAAYRQLSGVCRRMRSGTPR